MSGDGRVWDFDNLYREDDTVWVHSDEVIKLEVKISGLEYDLFEAQAEIERLKLINDQLTQELYTRTQEGR